MDSKSLTPQQQNVLRFVLDFTGEHSYPPTLREIGQALGLANLNAVRGHLAALEKKGHITRVPDRARSIQVVHSPSALSHVKRKLHEVLRTDEGVYHRVVYGLGWTTWRRQPLLTGPRRAWISEALEREAVEHGWTILERKIEPDHVVVVVEAWHNHSAERTVHRFQSAGKAVRRRHPGDFPGDALWGRGYVVTTSLDLLEPLVAQLLADQIPREQPEERGP